MKALDTAWHLSSNATAAWQCGPQLWCSLKYISHLFLSHFKNLLFTYFGTGMGPVSSMSGRGSTIIPPALVLKWGLIKLLWVALNLLLPKQALNMLFYCCLQRSWDYRPGLICLTKSDHGTTLSTLHTFYKETEAGWLNTLLQGPCMLSWRV